MDDEFIKAADQMFYAAVEFLGDWRKGDFDLPKLASCDAEALEVKVKEYSKQRWPDGPSHTCES